MLGLNRYQWTVLFAAWLGWGFDVFDGLLFNFVAPNCVPTLLGLPVGSPEAKAATLYWTGLLTSVLLLGWALGGVLFGYVCDRIGRLRTLMPEAGSAPPGIYRLTFDTASYFAVLGAKAFYPHVSVTFEVVQGEAHYHVPLLLSPFGYTTYRGS